MSQENQAAQAFIDHWSKAEASEMANSHSFIIGLTGVLGVQQPTNTHAEGYSFNFPIKVPGSTTSNFLDLYHRGRFVWESKQFVAPKEEQTDLELTAIKAGVVDAKKKSGPIRGSGAWDDAMIRAKGQAERYVRSLPTEEPNPPFIIVCDVGHSFEIYADFTQNGKAYLPFPDPRTFRIPLKDLADEQIRERLRLIWTDPAALDPAKISAEVTREIAGYLAELAKSLEHEKHAPEAVAQFLTRCLFCMFAEDVGLLPENSFTDLLKSIPPDGTGFVALVGTLFREMNTGTKGDISVVLRQKLLRFNGGLFADQTVLPISGLQLGLLKQAASKQWKNVEPAIFGTLLERALNPTERHALGAHFTPRAYVERLVLPTVIQPLREEWENVRAAAVTFANKDNLKAAQAEINRFHDQLCATTVLDPACGSGNFLYVALEHMKRLEGEVIDFSAALGDHQRLGLSDHTVDPHQFLGIELNPRAASIAELVLWIGYLQWHFRTRGNAMPDEPVLKSFKNIECRDAVLEYDGEPQPARDENGEIITQWDRRSMKVDFVTGLNVPDEIHRITLVNYENPRPAKWPVADFIVGNPPFIGKVRLRDDLGDGYAETLRKTYPAVPESADFVLYWWHKAAELTRTGHVKRFGFITTNSLRQTFARRVVQNQLSASPPLSLTFAISDHPWVDTAEGAAVRIAMTSGISGSHVGEVFEISEEVENEDGSSDVIFHPAKSGRISADLTVGADVSSMISLKANDMLASTGLILGGRGFVLNKESSQVFLKQNPHSSQLIFPLRNGEDVMNKSRDAFVIDTNGWSEERLRDEMPEIYQHLLTTVYPERQQNRDPKLQRQWWLFRRSNEYVRGAISGLTRFIVTVETAKHRVFTYFNAGTKPEHGLIAIGLDDALYLGILSSRLHVPFALASGGDLGGVTPRYNKTRCFDPFPFPLCDEATKDRIRAIAEELDAHRKRVQAEHGLTLTGIYNVLEKLRANQPLTDKDKTTHVKGLVSILKQLHDDLDATVFAAYGYSHLWELRQEAHQGSMYDFKTGMIAQLDAGPEGITAAIAAWERELDAEILTRLVALNAQRAAEEKQGIIHWLRPDYQTRFLKPDKQTKLNLTGTAKSPKAKKKVKKKAASKAKIPWPKPLAERIRVTEQALHAAGHPITAAEMAKQFSRAKPADLQEILESLFTLGRAQQNGETFTR